MGKFKSYTSSFFDTDNITTLVMIFFVSLFSMLLIPIFIWLGFLVNIIDEAQKDDFMDLISEKEFGELFKEGFLFSLTFFLITIIINVVNILLFFLLLFVLPVSSIVQLTTVGVIIISLVILISTILQIILLSPVPVVYAKERDFSIIYSKETYSKTLSNKEYYKYSLIGSLMMFVSSFTLIFAPLMITYSFGIFGLGVEEEEVEEDSIDVKEELFDDNKFKVFHVKSKSNLVNKKLTSGVGKDLNPRDIKNFKGSFPTYNEAFEFTKDETEDLIIIEISEEGEKLERRLLCDKCNLYIYTNSDQRFDHVQETHDKYHLID